MRGVLATAILFHASVLSATELHVPADYSSIRIALEASSPGDTIILADGTYSGEGNRDLQVTSSISIRSQSGDPESCILDCEDSARAFHFTGGNTNASLAGLAIVNGYEWQGGAIRIEDDAHISLYDCVISDNYSTGAGGGIYLVDAQASLDRCLISRNYAEGQAGGVLIAGRFSHVDFSQCTVVDNASGIYEASGVWMNATPYYQGPYLLASFTNCILAYNSWGQTSCINHSEASFECTDVYPNDDSSPNCFQGYAGINGNITSKPFFCDRYNGDYSLGVESPCLPANSECAEPMGVYGATCVLTDLQPGFVQQSVTYLHAYPNPFNPSIEVSYTLSESAVVGISIADVSGRHVAELQAPTYLGAGAHRVVWDGHDDDGHKLPSGVYLCTLRSETQTLVEKLSLLK